MTRRTIHLVRHGEVENPGRITYGRLPGFSLSDSGRAQAEQAAAELARRIEGPVVIVASPLDRARQSAEILRATLSPGADIRVDERLIEAGTWREGLPRQFEALRYFGRWIDGNARLKTELPRAVALRMREAVLDALEASPDATPVLVSHQLPIWMGRVAFEHRVATADEPLLVRWFPFAFVRDRCEPASITSLDFHARELVDVAYWDAARGPRTPPGR